MAEWLATMINPVAQSGASTMKRNLDLKIFSSVKYQEISNYRKRYKDLFFVVDAREED